MPALLQVRVVEDGRTAAEYPLNAPLEVGRQRPGEPRPYAYLPAQGDAIARLVIARQEDRDNVSRQHVLLEPLATGRVRSTNTGKSPLACDAVPGRTLAPGAAAEVAPPFNVDLPGRRALAVRSVGRPDAPALQSLDQCTIAPGWFPDLSQRLLALPDLSAPQMDEVVGWLQTTMGVLQATVGAADFSEKAVQALVQIVGLDSGRVLLLENDQWVVAATCGAEPGADADWQPSRHVLGEVRDKKKTFWQSGLPAGGADALSLALLDTVVAAPLLNADGAVIGALYGERCPDPLSSLQAGGKLEAALVELLACGVATGLARQKQEHVTLEAHVRFEQFFGSELAQRLAREPDLLAGRNAGVTLLFCDVRGFSRVSERLGPADTVRWINDVMGELSQRVLDESGVLVDYIGDELIAMWGAPRDQHDQEERAARAALAMLAALPAVNARWQDRLGEPTGVGVGLNTGPAQVGNTGCRFKFKYGPLGDTVNVASRIQGLTRYLKCRLLVAQATRQALGDEFIARRVVRTRVHNIERPLDLYEVERAGPAERRQFFAESEAALEALEAEDFAQAAGRAGSLLMEHRGDGPLLLTLSRASTAMMQDGRGFNAVWEPPGK